MQQSSAFSSDPSLLSAGNRTASDSTGTSEASRDLSQQLGVPGPSLSSHGGSAYAAFADAYRREGTGAAFQASPPRRSLSQTLFQQPGLGGHVPAYSQDIRQPGFHHENDPYPGQNAVGIFSQLAMQEWGHQAQLQQSLDQQTLLNHLQLISSQARGAQPHQGSPGHLGSLLSQQLLDAQKNAGRGSQQPFQGNLPGMDPQHASFSSKLPGMDGTQHGFPAQRLPPLMGWQVGRGAQQAQGHAPLGGSPLGDFQSMKHAYGGHDVVGDKKVQNWGHGPGHGGGHAGGHGGGHGGSHSAKGRQYDGSDGGSGPAMEKLRREVARLHSELERMEKEVARQKNLRETERVEFTEAKERLKHSWAADRDDFARVKSALKTKNAEHHAQSGRLSQQIKDMEAVCRGLRELCTRSGIQIPVDLDQHHKHPTPMPSPSDTSYDSDVPELRLASLGSSASGSRLAPPTSAAAQLISPAVASQASPASTVLSLMKQLPEVLARSRTSQDAQAGDRREDGQGEGAGDSDAAAQAAAKAAAALGQLAAALSHSRSASRDGSASPVRSRPASPALSSSSALEDIEIETTNLTRMSLQAWVKDSQSPSDGSRSPLSARSSEMACQPPHGSFSGEGHAGAGDGRWPGGGKAGSEDFTLHSTSGPFQKESAREPPVGAFVTVSEVAKASAQALEAAQVDTTTRLAGKDPVTDSHTLHMADVSTGGSIAPGEQVANVSSLAAARSSDEGRRPVPLDLPSGVTPSDVTLPSATSVGMSDTGFVDSE